MTPVQIKDAITWSLMQKDSEGNAITKDDCQHLVDAVRQYFNNNNVVYSTFSYDDVIPYL